MIVPLEVATSYYLSLQHHWSLGLGLSAVLRLLLSLKQCDPD